MKTTLISILTNTVIFIRKLIALAYKLPAPKSINKNIENLMLIEIEPVPEANKYVISFFNRTGLRHYDFFLSLWNSLNLLDEWNNIERKVIMISFFNPTTEKQFYITKNFVISSDTTLESYWEKVKKQLTSFWDLGSIEDTSDYTFISVEVWVPKNEKLASIKNLKRKTSMIQKRSYSTSVKQKNKWSINPLDSGGASSKNKICTLDVETMNLFDGLQVPVAITFAYKIKKEMHCFIILIDHKLLQSDKDAAILKLWKDLYEKVESLNLGTHLTIYSHNLGAFDGYYILPSLYSHSENPRSVNMSVDDRNKFISISYVFSRYLNISEEEAVKKNLTEEDLIKKSVYKWTFLDSYRLFPLSLDNLCKMYNVPGKFSEYKNEWNNISLFSNEAELNKFMEYSKQDSLCLLDALLRAKKIYIDKYDVNITKAVSTPSLSLLIFRRMYQMLSIPILKWDLDHKVRSSYFGGSSDYYHFHGKNIKYYDINSLYPFAMLKDMPLQFLYTIDGYLMKLEDTFGFIEAIITCPKDIDIPLLLHNHEGKNIHPTGTWKGTYFSEELKAAVEHGYTVELVKVHQFSRAKDLFKNFIDHFYELKKTATLNKDLTRKLIAKHHLITLYGMFGRKIVSLSSIPCKPSEEINILNKYPVKSIVKVNKDLNIFLIYNNVDFNLIKETNAELNINLLVQPRKLVKSNVAIASAITAYARIEMMKYKTIPGIKIYYTDTDSIFTNKELPNWMVGDDIGQMKDKLSGGWIKQAYFFGVKKYAYIDSVGNVVSVFSGLVRNSLTWKDILQLANGETLYKEIPKQFNKALSKLEISIKHKWVHVKFTPDKTLIGNKFQHIHINEISAKYIAKMSRLFIGRIKQLLGRTNKISNKPQYQCISDINLKAKCDSLDNWEVRLLCKEWHSIPITWIFLHIHTLLEHKQGQLYQ